MATTSMVCPPSWLWSHSIGLKLGPPFAIIDGTLMTWMRTGAVTAVGAKYLANDNPKVLGHIGARGTAWYNVAMMDFDF